MATRQGVIASYVHIGNRLGVLVEVSCESARIAESEEFRQLARDVAMQVAASPHAEYVSLADAPGTRREWVLAMELGREDLQGKPEALRARIARERGEERLREHALLEQPFIKEPSITVGILIERRSAHLGEPVRVRRFVRYDLGEDELPARFGLGGL